VWKLKGCFLTFVTTSQLDQEALRSFTLNLSNYDLGSGVSPYTVPVLDPAAREALPASGRTKKESRVKSQRRPHTADKVRKAKPPVSPTSKSNLVRNGRDG